MSGSVADIHTGPTYKESLRTPVVVQSFWTDYNFEGSLRMEFQGENVSSILGKLKRLAAVRGKLAVNAQKLYQVVRNGKIKAGICYSATKKRI